MFETLDIAVFQPLLLGIPESVGLLMFGVGLITMAMLLRWILGEGKEGKGDENVK
jgi:hypothetical protein